MYTVSFNDKQYNIGKDNDDIDFFGPNPSTLTTAVRESITNIHFNLAPNQDSSVVGIFYNETGNIIAVMRRVESINIPIYIN